jgi:hypothetical protein
VTEDSVLDEQQQTSLNQEMKLLIAFEKHSQTRIQQPFLGPDDSRSRGKEGESSDKLTAIALPM